MGHRAGKRFVAVVGLLVLVLSGCTWVSRASVDSGGAQADSYSEKPALSSDGRYIAFRSAASNLVTGDTNNAIDVFVRDAVTGTTTRVSVSSSGAEANNGPSPARPAISADGRYVAFDSLATNLVTGDTNSKWDVFVRDTVTGTTTRVSVSSNGGEAIDSSYDPAISGDGRYVAFSSDASNLVLGDTNNARDVFVKDTTTGATTRASVDSSNGEANGYSLSPATSTDGRYVAFESTASNLVTGDTNNARDVFVRDTTMGTTTRVNLDSSGVQAANNTSSEQPTISADGRYVAFRSLASNLVTGDTNNAQDAFVRDTTTGTTTRVSLSSSGTQANGNSSSDEPVISADGRYVTFDSNATNLVTGDTNAQWDVFVRDRVTGTTTRASLNENGTQAAGGSGYPVVSADGRYIAFHSAAPDLVTGDTNGTTDIYVRANPVVTISGVAPGSAARGVGTPVTITGTSFRPGVIVSAGNDIGVSNVVVVNETSITVTFTPGPSVPTGPRNVLVILPGTGPGAATGSTGLCSSCVTVT